MLLATFARYLFQKLLVAKSHSLLVAEVARCIKSLITRCEIRLLLFAEVARHKKITRYSLQKLHVAKNHLLLVVKFARYLLQKIILR